MGSSGINRPRTRLVVGALGGALAAALLSGCPKGDTGADGDGGTSGAAAPSFSLAWSEYPSWSTFGVAHEAKLINGNQGELGEIEKKWNVDIVLKEADYDSCLTMYATLACDAVCITNMDVLQPSLSRPSVAVLPTSTSKGADACIVAGVESVQDLKGKKVYGLEKSVSEYCFVRNLELLGEQEADYSFVNKDPGAAATAMQQKQEGYEAIVVWNPFVLETLNKRPDAKVLFDSSTIPGEIVDMVVIGQETLDKPGGERFAAAVIDTFYAINQRLADPAKGDETLVALGKKFSNLGLEDMKKVVAQTVFYKDPAEGRGLFTGAELPKTMERVVSFCVSHKITDKEPALAYGPKDAGAGAALRFDPTFIDMAKARQ